MSFTPGLDWSEEPPIQFGDTEILARLVVRSHGADWWLRWDSKNGGESVLMPCRAEHTDRAVMERDAFELAASRTPELAPEPVKAVVNEANDVARRANAHLTDGILEVQGGYEDGLPVLRGKVTTVLTNCDGTRFNRFTCEVRAIYSVRVGCSVMVCRDGKQLWATYRVTNPEQLADCAHELALQLQKELGLRDFSCHHRILPLLSEELRFAGFDLHHWEAGTDPDEPDEFRIVAYGFVPAPWDMVQSEMGVWLEKGKIVFSGLMSHSYQAENQYGDTAAECVEKLKEYYVQWQKGSEQAMASYWEEYRAEHGHEYVPMTREQLIAAASEDIPF